MRAGERERERERLSEAGRKREAMDASNGGKCEKRGEARRIDEPMIIRDSSESRSEKITICDVVKYIYNMTNLEICEERDTLIPTPCQQKDIT